MQALDLQGNALTGGIPASWIDGMPALTAVSLANNPALCPTGGADVASPGSNKPKVFYSPCDPASPTLPGISPNYPVTNSVRQKGWNGATVHARLLLLLRSNGCVCHASSTSNSSSSLAGTRHPGC